MARGSKASYTGKQKRQAEHIEEGYESRGVGKKEAERRAWATVNKSSGGGKKSGSGRGKKVNKAPSRKGGRLGGQAKKKRLTKHRYDNLDIITHHPGSFSLVGRVAGLAVQPQLGILSEAADWEQCCSSC